MRRGKAQMILAMRLGRCIETRFASCLPPIRRASGEAVRSADLPQRSAFCAACDSLFCRARPAAKIGSPFDSAEWDPIGRREKEDASSVG